MKALLLARLRGMAKSSKPQFVNINRLAIEFNLDTQTVRKEMAKLRVTDHIAYIPLGSGNKGVYVLFVDGVNNEAFNRDLRRKLRHAIGELNQQYKPFAGYVKDQRLSKVMERLFEAAELLEQEETK